MIDIVKIITNDRGAVTRVIASKGQRYSLAELAEQIGGGQECFALFSDKTRCQVTTTLDAANRTVAIVHDPVGKRTLLDLPEHEDTGDDDIDAMFNDLTGKHAHEDDFGEDMTIGDTPTGPTE